MLLHEFTLNVLFELLTEHSWIFGFFKKKNIPFGSHLHYKKQMNDKIQTKFYLISWNILNRLNRWYHFEPQCKMEFFHTVFQFFFCLFGVMHEFNGFLKNESSFSFKIFARRYNKILRRFEELQLFITAT